MKKNLFGIGVEILMFKTEYDKRMENVAAIKEQLATQLDVAHKAANAVYDNLVLAIDSHLAGNDLQKLAGHRGLLKSANANAREHMEVFKRLKAEVVGAQAYANDAFHDHAAVYMKSSVPPVGAGPTYRIVDPKATLSDIQLGRRFQQ